MTHLSDSRVQLYAEKLILNGLEDKLNILKGSLQSKRIKFDKTFVEIDGYSKEHKIMVEVFARLGKLSAAHYEKLANDILKLILVEDKFNVPHRKYIAVCGEDAVRYLTGQSWKAFAVKYYNFEVVKIDLPLEFNERILYAQQNQKEGMKL